MSCVVLSDKTSNEEQYIVSFYPTRHQTKNNILSRFIRQDIKQRAVSCVGNVYTLCESFSSQSISRGGSNETNGMQTGTMPCSFGKDRAFVHGEDPLSFCCYCIGFLSAVTVSPFFLLLQYPPSFCCYSIALLSAVTVSPSFCCYSITLLSAVTVSPFFQLLQYHPSFCFYSITLLSTVTVSPFFLLLEYRSSFCC